MTGVRFLSCCVLLVMASYCHSLSVAVAVTGLAIVWAMDGISGQIQHAIRGRP